MSPWRVSSQNVKVLIVLYCTLKGEIFNRIISAEGHVWIPIKSRITSKKTVMMFPLHLKVSESSNAVFSKCERLLHSFNLIHAFLHFYMQKSHAFRQTSHRRRQRTKTLPLHLKVSGPSSAVFSKCERLLYFFIF